MWCLGLVRCGLFARYVGHVLGNVHAHGSGRIWLDEVSCPNDSCLADLNRCSHSQWGVHDCHHGEDVSIACYDHTATAEPTTAPRTTTATTSTTAPGKSQRVTAIYSCFFHSCIVHPCCLLLHFSLMHFPPLLSTLDFSTPVFTTPAFSAPPPH